MTGLSSNAPRILVLWSTPRSMSTAFFRMMIERDDFTVLHEPFSYRAEFGSVEIDGVHLETELDLIAHIHALARVRPVFFKDTTDERYPGVLADRKFLGINAVHTFMIRDPRETIASYHRINPDMRPEQIGFEHQEELFNAVAHASGRAPFIMDARQLVEDPAATVRTFCQRTGIPFQENALSWEPGDRPEWGPSQRWHREAACSTGFTARPTDEAALENLLTLPRMAAVLAAQRTHYDILRQYVSVDAV